MKPPVNRPEPKKPKKQRQFKLPRIRLPKTGPNTPWLIVIVALAFSVFMFMQYREAKTKLQPAAASKKQVTSLVGSVAKLAVVPTDETPTVITVLDAEKVNNQTFYADAKDGDKVLVFNKKKRAILYRPSTNQIVNIAPIVVAPSGATQTQ